MAEIVEKGGAALTGAAKESGLTVGQYMTVSMALNSFGVPLDDFLPGAAP